MVTVLVKDQPTTEKVVKVCLFGGSAVGKTSLIRRFVLNEFDDKYLVTIGTKVSRKDLEIKDPVRKKIVSYTLMIWDIIGHKSFRKLLASAYFRGAHSAIGVCDITRKDTLHELHDWINSIYKVTGKIPIVILANKIDLKAHAAFDEDDLTRIASYYAAPYLFTSAKTGENVEKAFEIVATLIAQVSKR
jgi:small GTP-binding protein